MFIISTISLTLILLTIFIYLKQVPKKESSEIIIPNTTANSLGETPLQNISWEQTLSTQLPQTSNIYKIILNPLNAPTTQKIAQTLSFSGFAQTDEYSHIPILNWQSQTHNLAIYTQTKQIVYTNINSEYISSQGLFTKPIEDITQETISLIKNLDIFDPNLEFKLTQTEYFLSYPGYYEPTTQAKAHLTTLTFNPYLNNQPIYLSENFFIQITYDKEGKIIKLKINNPIQTIEEKQKIDLINFEQLQSLSPQNFFTVNIDPQTLEDYYVQLPQITSITPEEISSAYILDPKQNLILPIFTVEKEKKYIFATPAGK